jgi:hypothetical protein
MRFDGSRTCWSKQKRNQHQEDPEEMSLMRLKGKSHDGSTWKIKRNADGLQLR